MHVECVLVSVPCAHGSLQPVLSSRCSNVATNLYIHDFQPSPFPTLPWLASFSCFINIIFMELCCTAVWILAFSMASNIVWLII